VEIEKFAAARRLRTLKAVTRYRALFQAVATDSGPWATPEHIPKRHFKLQNIVFKMFVRVRMKPNLEFNDHRAASLARDLGSFDNAREISERTQSNEDARI
jgi:hypothetical protein